MAKKPESEQQTPEKNYPSAKKNVLKAAVDGEGCLGKAAEGEPVFVLRAQDIFAPELVEEWADRVAKVAKEAAAEITTDPSEKIAEARGIAEDIRAWQRANGAKMPD